MPLPSPSTHWSEGVNGDGAFGGCHRPFSKGSSHINRPLSLDLSSFSSFAVGLPRDMINGLHAAGTGSSFEWLQPWRTPQDCLEGGLGLLYSMREMLEHAQRARQRSVNELYAMHATEGSAVSTANSCRCGSSGPPRAGSGGSSSSSSDNAGCPNTPLSLSVRRSSHRALRLMSKCDDADGSAAGSRACSVGQRSRRGGGEHRVSLLESSPSTGKGSVQEFEPAGAVEEVTPPRVSEASAASVPRVVPVIPRFEEVKRGQELTRQRLQQQLSLHPHPRSDAARRKRRASINSNDDDDDGAHSPHHPDGKCDQTARPGDLRRRPGTSLELGFSDGNGDEPPYSPQRRHTASASARDDNDAGHSRRA
ncbi:hypothetical protein JIQ42_08481 [Leishmania sp. Namibia]|uniref:hypothetical protein n=1 Tax=Leishmania sp. Namibia TaxID=2802991 RepID=UPI001B556A8E|nr:hypothetical protein JIQ42_08481 [Leishmania sp. Namibia]